MPKPRLRRLVVDGATYLWKVEHQHHVLPGQGENGQAGCREVFSAFLEGHKASPVRVQFNQGPGFGAGYPEAGVVNVWGSGESYNLNLPSVAAALVRAALARGWRPAEVRQPFVVEDGFGLARGAAPGLSTAR